MSYHGGYEFQDRIAVFLAVKEFLRGNDSEIICENKQFQNDDFDDIVIKTSSELIKHQIKYSKDSFITQNMLSSGDLYFLDQYSTYKELLRTHQDFRLRIITNREIKEDLFVKTDETNFTLTIFKINSKKIIENGVINKSFRKLRAELPEEDYELFEEFLSKIEYYSVPKHVSFDFFRSGDFEKLILHSLEFEIGIGKYPNHDKNSVEISLRLEEIMQALRIGTKLYEKQIRIDKLFKQLGITRISEKLNQKFPINSEDYIERTSTIQKILTSITKNDRLLVIGEPGVGKSWLVEKILEQMNSCIVKYSFYISLEDPNYYERTDIYALLYDLKAQIIKQKLATIEDFDMRSSVSIDEVVRVINNINRDFVLILDGLDHIERISSKSNFKLIIGFVEQITNPKIKILCVSQQIDDIKKFKKEYVDYVTLSEVQRYTSKFMMDEFSDVFFKFSNGNFLYLSYLTRKYKGMKLEEFSEVYSYDGNISRYYDSLLVGNDYSNEILSLISATNIPLNSYEIKEILHRLHLDSVEDGINDIKYLFSY
ncbi:MAG: NACHT domain-containing protein, partial [Acholeplasmataceae bacterium]|nr:NACHT domain-containing protein [Acholeplasmataceae bacterium]